MLNKVLRKKKKKTVLKHLFLPISE